MRARNHYLKLTHPLLANWLNPELQAEDIYSRMLSLEQARDQALQLLPNPEQSQRQQRALDILTRQTCLEQMFRQRCRALQQAGLSEQQQTSLREELSLSYFQACQRLMIGWPVLSSEECEALPLLLMRQSVALEIDRRLESLKIELQAG